MKTRLLIVVAAALAAPGTAVAADGMGMGMGPMHTTRIASFQGYYDGHKDVFLSTDVSAPGEAKAEHINFSRKLGASAKTSEEIYMVSGRAAAGQLPVFSSEPGEKTYTPLWHEEFVTWRGGVTPQLLTSDTQIEALEKKGMIHVRETSVVLNCPIVKVGM
jgi:hypothetical protein